jgi:hypothetical protein
MKIVEEFVSNLNNIDIDLYGKKGFTREEIEDYIFACNPILKRVYPKKLLEDPILYFFYYYDHNLTDITFFNAYEKTFLRKEFYYVFGDFDRMPICLNIVTKEIVMLDEQNNTVISCAVDSKSFLDVIIESAKSYIAYITDMDIDIELMNDDESKYDDDNILLAQKCSEIAGGIKYFPFYKLMFIDK